MWGSLKFNPFCLQIQEISLPVIILCASYKSNEQRKGLPLPELKHITNHHNNNWLKASNNDLKPLCPHLLLYHLEGNLLNTSLFYLCSGKVQWLSIVLRYGSGSAVGSCCNTPIFSLFSIKVCVRGGCGQLPLAAHWPGIWWLYCSIVATTHQPHSGPACSLHEKLIIFMREWLSVQYLERVLLQSQNWKGF